MPGNNVSVLNVSAVWCEASPDLKLDCSTIWQMHRVAHESCPHRNLAGWVKLASDIAQH